MAAAGSIDPVCRRFYLKRALLEILRFADLIGAAHQGLVHGGNGIDLGHDAFYDACRIKPFSRSSPTRLMDDFQQILQVVASMRRQFGEGITQFGNFFVEVNGENFLHDRDVLKLTIGLDDEKRKCVRIPDFIQKCRV
jgi:hypothetical protein